MNQTPNLGLPIYEDTDALNMSAGYNSAMTILDDMVGGIEFKELDFKYASNAGLSITSTLYGINMSNNLCIIVCDVQLQGTPASDKASAQLTHTLPTGLTYNSQTGGQKNGVIYPINNVTDASVIYFNFGPNIIVKADNYSQKTMAGRCIQMCVYNGNYTA